MSIKFVGNKSIKKLISIIKNYIDESVKPLKGKSGQLIGFDENGDQIPVEIKIPSVSVTPAASSGTKVGTITIDGKSYDLYAPSVTTDSIGAANKSHNHNDIYYTESEIDSQLANKSNNDHTHDYAATDHSHSGYVQTSKITQSSSVTATGQYVLDAIEKNASIAGTLAHQIAQVNGNLNNVKDITDKLAFNESSPIGKVYFQMSQIVYNGLPYDGVGFTISNPNDLFQATLWITWEGGCYYQVKVDGAVRPLVKLG